MAAKDYEWTGASSSAWETSGNWDLDDGTVPGTNDPADTASFLSGVVDCDLDGDRTLGEFITGPGYIGTLDFNGHTLDIDWANGVGIHRNTTIADTGSGGGIECAADFFIITALPDGFTVTLNGTGNVSANVAANRADLTVATSGTHTAITAAYWDSFAGCAVGGAYNDGGNIHTIAGDILIATGMLTSTAKWIMSDDGNLHITNTCILADLEIANTKTATTVTFHSYLKKLSGSGSVTGPFDLIFFTGTANGFWADWSGTCNVSVYVRSGATTTPGADMTISNDKNLFLSSNSVLSMDANLNVARKILMPDSGAGTGGLYMNTYNLTVGNSIEVGQNASSLAMTVKLGSGTHTIQAINVGPGSTGGTQTVNLEICDLMIAKALHPESLTINNEFGAQVIPEPLRAMRIGGRHQLRAA